MTGGDTHEYDDIIDLPHHVSEKRQHMSVRNRAAQFSSFAALKGYEEAVMETADLNEEHMRLKEEQHEYFEDI